MKSDFINRADDVGDFSAACVNRIHRLNRLIHHIATLFRLMAGGAGQLIGLTGVGGALFYRAGQLLHAGGGFFQGGSLLLGALRQIGAALGNFSGSSFDGFSGGLRLPDNPPQIGVDRVHGDQHFADLVPALHCNISGQIALGQPLGRDLALLHRGQNAAHHP